MIADRESGLAGADDDDFDLLHVLEGGDRSRPARRVDLIDAEYLHETYLYR